MKEIVFATNNPHKLTEIKHLVRGKYTIIGLKEKGVDEEIPEDHHTLEENAFQKAEFIYNRFGCNCFADDTGLEIDALGCEPGVFSARYSRIGSPVYPEMEITRGNIRKVLEKLQNQPERTARFRTVIALILEGETYYFEGRVEGTINHQTVGEVGFGYDPIFIPKGEERTFAEMSMEIKNRISHRALAVNKLIAFLNHPGQNYP